MRGERVGASVGAAGIQRRGVGDALAARSLPTTDPRRDTGSHGAGADRRAKPDPASHADAGPAGDRADARRYPGALAGTRRHPGALDTDPCAADSPAAVNTAAWTTVASALANPRPHRGRGAEAHAQPDGGRSGG